MRKGAEYLPITPPLQKVINHYSRYQIIIIIIIIIIINYIKLGPGNKKIPGCLTNYLYSPLVMLAEAAVTKTS